MVERPRRRRRPILEPDAARPVSPVSPDTDQASQSDAAAPSVEPEPTPAAPRRVSITLGDDGRPDLSRMRADTRAQLADWLKDGRLSSDLGIVGDAAPSGPDPVASLLALPLLTAIGQIQAFVLQRITGAPGDVVLSVSAYTPDEQQQLIPSLVAVVSKYSGTWTTKYGQELALAGMLIAIGATKAQQINLAMRQAPQPPQPPADDDSVRVSGPVLQ